MSTEHKKVSQVRITEDLRDGRILPVYEAVSIGNKIKPRKFSVVVNTYLPLKVLASCLDCGNKIVQFKSISRESAVKASVEEDLLRLTHKIAVVASNNQADRKEFLIPQNNSTTFTQISFKYIKIEEKLFYKCVTDDNGMALLKFKYSINGRNNIVSLTTYYVDSYTLQLSKHSEYITLNADQNFKFDILLKSGILCIIWPYENNYTILNLTDPNANFTYFNIEEELPANYTAKLYGCYLQITINDNDFEDSVFSVKDVSKRLTLYYSVYTGNKFDSKRVLADVSELVYLDHPSDVIFVDLPGSPMWFILEWLLPETTLGKLIFCGVSDGYVSSILKETNLSVLFSEYKTFFKKTNESQSSIEICPSTLQMFIWISARHIAVISLTNLQIVSILELSTTKYSDFKGDHHRFALKTSRDGRAVTAFIKKGRDVLHYELFVLPELQSLTTLSIRAVLKAYPKYLLEKQELPPLLKSRLLQAY